MNTDLDGEVQKQRARYVVIQRSLVVIGTVVLLVAFALLVFTSVQGYYARQELIDCTTPEGECYQEGQKETGKAVDAIVRETIENAKPLHADTRVMAAMAAYCSHQREAQTYQEMLDCIEDLVATEPSRELPVPSP
jgi:hypothetical protein